MGTSRARSTKILERLGADASGKRAGVVYLQVDYDVAKLAVKRELERKGVVVMQIGDAIKKLGTARERLWRALSPAQDEFTELAAERETRGVFVYVPDGVRVKLPIQACFLVSREEVEQIAHNVIVLGEGAELTVNTTCAAIAGESLHVGVTEAYVGKRARLNFVMIHGWVEGAEARPRTGVLVEEGGEFVAHYANLRPVRLLQATPKILLKEKASSYYSSVLVGRRASEIDVGVEVEFLGEKSRGEVVSRSVARDSSKIVMRGTLRGRAAGARGHLECRGLQLSGEARITAIPVLESLTPGSSLTHEAAIGRISEEELSYLMSRGFTEEEAISLVVRGFVDIGWDRLPPSLRPQLKGVIDLVAKMASG